MDYSNKSSSVGSSSNESNYDLEDSGEDFNVEGDVNIIQPYAFEPVEETTFCDITYTHRSDTSAKENNNYSLS